MQWYKMILKSPDGTQVMSENIAKDERCETLKEGRRILFGKRGKISYVNHRVVYETATLEIVPQS